MKKNLTFYKNLLLKPFLITKVLNKSQTLRGIQEQNWGLRFSFAIKESEWFTKTRLNPGRWAMGFPALYALYRILEEMHPKSILEFGLGESSKLTYQYHSLFENTALAIIEQDSEWVNFFDKKIFKIQNVIKLLPIKEEKRFDKKCYIYDNLIPAIQEQKYDCVIIDGPWGSNNFSRSQIIDIIENDLLADDFAILMDDINRFGERQTLELIFLSLKQKGIKYRKGIYSGEKDVCVICSESLKFLTSL